MTTPQRNQSPNQRRRSRDDHLTKDELQTLYKACEDIEEKLLVCGLGQLGLRVGELAHLEKAWLDFQDDRLVIPSSMECDCFEC